MVNIKILDCTLRDGGYVNDWDFNENQSKDILSYLDFAGIDFIETGFLTYETNFVNKTLFNSFEAIEKIIPEKVNKKKLLAMIKYGKFPIEKIPSVCNSSVNGLRLIFKKNQQNDALTYCKKIKTKGYKLFINPTFIDQYNESEIIEIINEVNKIMPYGFTIVDSAGTLDEKASVNLFKLVDQNLDKNIKICLHSHNNLQLSFKNAKNIIELGKDRDLIIDSTILGIGRGAGNLCLEEIAQYLNQNCSGKYKIESIMEIAEKQIKPICIKSPWGYSKKYEITALNHCHPNYGTYLVNIKKLPIEKLDKMLKHIPCNKRSTYDELLIEKIYQQNFLLPI